MIFRLLSLLPKTPHFCHYRTYPPLSQLHSTFTPFTHHFGKQLAILFLKLKFSGHLLLRNQRLRKVHSHSSQTIIERLVVLSEEVQRVSVNYLVKMIMIFAQATLTCLVNPS